MAIVAVILNPPAIVEQVRYRRYKPRYIIKVPRRQAPQTEVGVAAWEENVIVEHIYIVKPIVTNPEIFEERWRAMGGKKGDRLR
jgi:hypothetical protein